MGAMPVDENGAATEPYEALRAELGKCSYANQAQINGIIDRVDKLECGYAHCAPLRAMLKVSVFRTSQDTSLMSVLAPIVRRKEITVSKVSRVDVSDSSFIYLDQLDDGSFRVAYTPDNTEALRAMRDAGVLVEVDKAPCPQLEFPPDTINPLRPIGEQTKDRS